MEWNKPVKPRPWNDMRWTAERLVPTLFLEEMPGPIYRALDKVDLTLRLARTAEQGKRGGGDAAWRRQHVYFWRRSLARDLVNLRLAIQFERANL